MPKIYESSQQSAPIKRRVNISWRNLMINDLRPMISICFSGHSMIYIYCMQFCWADQTHIYCPAIWWAITWHCSNRGFVNCFDDGNSIINFPLLKIPRTALSWRLVTTQTCSLIKFRIHGIFLMWMKFMLSVIYLCLLKIGCARDYSIEKLK